MKKATSLFVAFIAVSIYSTLTASPASSQTNFKNFIVNADTTLTEKTSPAFDVRIIKDSNSQKFILIVSNPLTEKLQLSIAAASTPGFKQQIDGVSFRKRIDMTGADDDFYTITVSNKKQRVSKSFSLYTDSNNMRALTIE
ncbi:MAG: hypothetical protein J7497_13890 [Chitinophagaceae bacterium]|nr:hypothetical protein [Chitinophagaceae bacterium]